MQLRLLRLFQNGSWIAGIGVLLLSPFALEHNWLYAVMLVIVFVFFPWAVSNIHALAAGTQYRFWRLNELSDLGSTTTVLVVRNLLGFLVLCGALLNLVKWPSWWVVLFDAGILVGPSCAFFLFGAASMYDTAIKMVEGGAFKTCSNDHEFPPFERSCPYCTAAKNLELKHEIRRA